MATQSPGAPWLQSGVGQALSDQAAAHQTEVCSQLTTGEFQIGDIMCRPAYLTSMRSIMKATTGRNTNRSAQREDMQMTPPHS